MTGAYGVNDPTLTRRRVEADLAVLRDYQGKYRGMKEACLQQLNWGVERYAQLPQPPELLALKDVPSFWAGLGPGLVMGIAWIVLSFIAICAIVVVDSFLTNPVFPWLGGKHIPFAVYLITFGGSVPFVLSGFFPHFRAILANGKRPRENARRQEVHEEAIAVALKTAEPLKAAEDYRLRIQIRECESLAKTVGEKEAETRRLLATL
jgi:hypothetical protein